MTHIYIIRIWLKQLQRQRSSNIWVGRLETQREPMWASVWVWVYRPENQESQRIRFQFKPWNAGDPGRADVSFWVWRLEKINVPAQGIRQEGVPSFSWEDQPFVLLRLSVDWMGAPLHESEQSSFFSLSIQMFISSQNALTAHSRLGLTQYLSPSWLSQIDFYKINHHDIRE